MSNKVITRLNKFQGLTDILVQIEDFLDGLDLYVFENWIEGEIARGPYVNRYWVDLDLLYPAELMPDPQGGLRLTKHGVKVYYKKVKQKVPVEVKSRDDYRDDRAGKPKIEEKDAWLVSLSIPRKFIEELDDDDLELHDEDVNIDSISDARDEQVDVTDAYDEGATEDTPDDAESDKAGDENEAN